MMVLILYISRSCDKAVEYPEEIEFLPLSFGWWHRHEKALQAMQSCADACVCFGTVIAYEKTDALTSHEKTCKVLGSFYT